jgi:hypothetical protein
MEIWSRISLTQKKKKKKKPIFFFLLFGHRKNAGRPTFSVTGAGRDPPESNSYPNKDLKHVVSISQTYCAAMEWLVNRVL